MKIKLINIISEVKIIKNKIFAEINSRKNSYWISVNFDIENIRFDGIVAEDGKNVIVRSLIHYIHILESYLKQNNIEYNEGAEGIFIIDIAYFNFTKKKNVKKLGEVKIIKSKIPAKIYDYRANPYRKIVILDGTDSKGFIYSDEESKVYFDSNKNLLNYLKEKNIPYIIDDENNSLIVPIEYFDLLNIEINEMKLTNILLENMSLFKCQILIKTDININKLDIFNQIRALPNIVTLNIKSSSFLDSKRTSQFEYSLIDIKFISRQTPDKDLESIKKYALSGVTKIQGLRQFLPRLKTLEQIQKY